MIINDILPKTNDERTDEELHESPDGKTTQQEEDRKGREEKPIPVIETANGFSVGAEEQASGPITPQPRNSGGYSLPADGGEVMKTGKKSLSPAQSISDFYDNLLERIKPDYSDAYSKEELPTVLYVGGQTEGNRPDIQTKPLYD